MNIFQTVNPVQALRSIPPLPKDTPRSSFLCSIIGHNKWWVMDGSGDFKCFRCGLTGNDGGPFKPDII